MKNDPAECALNIWAYVVQMNWDLDSHDTSNDWLPRAPYTHSDPTPGLALNDSRNDSLRIATEVERLLRDYPTRTRKCLREKYVGRQISTTIGYSCNGPVMRFRYDGPCADKIVGKRVGIKPLTVWRIIDAAKSRLRIQLRELEKIKTRADAKAHPRVRAKPGARSEVAWVFSARARIQA